MAALRLALVFSAALTCESVSVRHAETAEAPLKVELDYEVLCPYCEDLIYNMNDMKEDTEFMARLDIEMRPFGNADIVPETRVSEGYHFFYPDATYPIIMCQHGERECLGNAIQACTFDIAGKAKGLDLALCMAAEGTQGHGVEMSAYSCLKSLDIDTETVRSCAKGQKGQGILVAMSERANREELRRKYVPWVTVDGKHLEVGDDHDLSKALCTLMKPPLPARCVQDTNFLLAPETIMKVAVNKTKLTGPVCQRPLDMQL